PRMIGIRPTLSDSQPQKMSVGVAINSAMPTIQLEVSTSSFLTVWRKYSAQNWPLYHTQPCPSTTTLAMTTYLKLALMKASRHGFVVVRPLAFMSWKIGVSPSESRIQMAMATSSSELMNGRRQPQSVKASTPGYHRMPMMTASDRTIPSVGDVWSHPV